MNYETTTVIAFHPKHQSALCLRSSTMRLKVIVIMEREGVAQPIEESQWEGEVMYTIYSPKLQVIVL